MHIDFASRPCPLCGCADDEPIFTDINRREGLPVSATLVECQTCDMQYLNPAPSIASLIHLYRDGSVDPVTFELAIVQPASRTLTPAGQHIIGSINGFLRGHPHDWPAEDGHGRNILDFGCHTGEKLVHWYQRGWQVAGIDLNRAAIEAAKLRFPDGHFWCGDLLELNIPHRFDFIRADNVVEHLQDPLAYLTALGNLLKPGGKLRVFVPNGKALSAKLFGYYSAVYWMPFHLNFFSQSTLRRALQQAGFANVNCQTFTPIGSWTWTQRQILLKPGFNNCPISALDRVMRRMSILNYPGETLAQWLGLGEELVATGQKNG